MGVESFLLSSTVIGVLAQRLIRLLCEKCKSENTTITPEIRKELGIKDEVTVFHAVGCEECNHTGYRGRTGIHELLIVDEEVQKMIHSEAHEHEMEKYAIKHLGMNTLRMDAMNWLNEGKTSLEEVEFVTKE
jgi:general secretion pathway protein E